MAPLEPDLARALRRKPAPPGLAERILSRLPPQTRPEQSLRRARLRWAWSFASVVVLCLGLGAFYVNGRRVERRNEEARQQLVETLTIASRSIARAESRAFSGEAWSRMRERLEQIGTPVDDDAPMHSPASRPRI